MFFRFAAAIGLATAVGLMAIAIEKQNLSLKRAISLQHYQIDVLREHRCRLTLQTQSLQAPPRLMEQWKHASERERSVSR
ncbi:hypothetical protein SH661x_001225 [Planctomicrobium sp. SH661]|uniref:hypothetical protein n=1 Tax=Planctomicrobium sp. SH661 TaxID=3448124 RepID=UPI003F5C5461